MLWGTTYVLVRIGQADLGPMTLAGIRYTLAGFILLPFLKTKKIQIKDYRKNYWQLALLGILSFTIANGSSGFALVYLPSTTVSFVTSLTTPLVLLFGIIFLNEIPSALKIAGVGLSIVGLMMYFPEQTLSFNNPGYWFLLISLLGFAFYTILGRFVARSGDVPFLVQTSIPFIVGGGLLLTLALIFEELPSFTLKSGLILIWMVIFNCIIGYLLYNQSLAVLTALEVNMVTKLQMFFSAVFAFFLLGEKISFLQILAMIVVFFGVYLVQRQTRFKPIIPQ
jgi:drug/metabolite transporter (DMT)-like permease